MEQNETNNINFCCASFNEILLYCFITYTIILKSYRLCLLSEI